MKTEIKEIKVKTATKTEIKSETKVKVAAKAEVKSEIQAKTTTKITSKPTFKPTQQAILAVSFGTSYPESRENAIGAIEHALAESFPDFAVRRAFTSKTIIRKLKERDGLVIDNAEEGLKRAKAEGIKALVVQPTYLMSGFEYMRLEETLKGYQDQFEALELAAPLLSSEEDGEAVARAITKISAPYDDGKTAICFMGHGTEAKANTVYEMLQKKLEQAGFGNYYIGTVEASPGLEELVDKLNKAGIYKRVVLQPLMVVAGDHANHDMAGTGEDSWKSRLEKEGYKVECVLKGLGEFPAVQKIYVSHAQQAVNRLFDKVKA